MLGMRFAKRLQTDVLDGFEQPEQPRAAIRRVLDDPDETWAPAELVRRIVEGEHPVRVWRTHRGMTARSLAAAAGIPSSYLSAIERGVKPGSVKALKSLATALDVPLDDLV